MPLDWHALVDGMSDVMKLVHLASRMDTVDEEEWRSTFLRERRRAYEDELTIQARRMGCNSRRGRLAEGPILSALNDTSRTDAQSVVNTFNYYLAAAIIRIHDEVPTANRYVYARRLAAWAPTYWSWKQPQIDQMTDGTARAKAQQDFYARNGHFGSARLLPTTAVCPVCQGWIARGIVPLRVAQQYPPPYHPNCPHYWSTRPDKIAKEDCQNLWMGE